MNKRGCTLVVLLLSVVLLLASCGESNPVTPITEGFTCRATITYREMSIEGDLTCGKDGTVEIGFIQPKSLSGITLRWDGAEMRMMLGKMSLAVPADKAPQSALICCLAKVLAADHSNGSRSDSGYVVTGEVEEKSFELVCDPATGYPVSLSIPEEELSATFMQFNLLNSTE